MTEMSIEQSLNTLKFTELADVHKHCGGGFDFNRGPKGHPDWNKASAIQWLCANRPPSAIREGIEYALEQARLKKSKTSATPTKSESITPTETTVQNITVDADTGALLTELAKRLGGGVDEVKLQQIVDARIADAVQRLVKRVEVKVPELEVRDVGMQHEMFETLLHACNARTPDGHRLNVWLKGPAGSGKTTAARNVAKALGLMFTFNGAISTEYALTGFIDASGRYNRTPFRDAWEHGGVYLFDEVDSSNPNAVLAFNAALANGVFAFPDGIVPRHPDCVIIAGANTAGNGASSEYNGRFKQDAAFLDRFVYLEWGVDEKLESAISPNAAWTERVQSIRAKVTERGVKGHLVTPRATVYGAALLAAGLSQKQVEAMVLRKGLSDEVWNNVK